ncbi:hypothetical protein JDV02_009710 [Purpureocillium takamizusanense]|uniref:Ankyrin n=1 Tax=Purpureocillium takamizusanense TaxID=2060973 RepID=A0A9Q8QMJ2_9HYPO|nr:uncharacterized protein JDV02_009710 [Purpureocillium takamizusanense]UNI23919.1 hypothetical protein JDV02_009710 [Purpureocillium takamizusanense]
MEGILSRSRSEAEDVGFESNGDEEPFRHEPVRGLPWDWELNDDVDVNAFGLSTSGMNLKKLFTFSQDELEVRDKDGKTPLHHFIENWSEDALIAFVQMIAETETAPDEPPDGARESGSSLDGASYSKKSRAESKALPLIADGLGRTTLDYASERSVLLGSLAFGIAKWSSEQLSNGICIAASCGYAVLVDVLCEMIDETPGVDSSPEAVELGPAVIEASKRGFTDIIRLLRQRGANLRYQDDNGMSPLHHAAYGCHTDAVRLLLLEGADPNQLDKAGRSPLFCGCESDSDAIIMLMWEKGASTTRASGDGQTLLHLAAYRGNVDVIRRLIRLDGGAVQLRAPGPGAEGLSLLSPLHIAAREGHNVAVKVLVEEGFQADAHDGDGRTPLSHASEGGHLKTVQVLLAKRRLAGVQSKDAKRRTALSYAAAQGHIDVVAALVSQGGADPNTKDFEGKTALIHAAQQGHSDTVVVLILLASNNYAVRSAVKRSFNELSSRFSSMPPGNIPVDVNVRDHQGRSAVSYLKKIGKKGNSEALEVARYILEIGEKPKAKSPMASSEDGSRIFHDDGNAAESREILPAAAEEDTTQQSQVVDAPGPEGDQVMQIWGGSS